MKKRELYNKVLLPDFSTKTLLLMLNWTITLTLLLVLEVSANSYSQNVKVNLDFQNVKFKRALAILEQKGNIRLLYSEENIPADKYITLSVKDTPVMDVLSMVLKDTGLKFKLLDNGLVVISPQSKDFKDIVVRGQVTDSKGETLPGVSIKLKGTSIGATTDLEGRYTINVPDNISVLVFTYIGYVTQEVAVNGRAVIDLVLAEDMKSLDEVVVIGYGTQKKVDLTGAVTQVDAADILGSRPLSNMASALQGSIPGLQITSNSGRPGETPNISIRGTMSINGGSPLVLVDNVPMDINDINPADIKTISVLKDASSSSIYGGRAAFGVILISTKKGLRNQPIRFNYSNNITFSQPIDLPEKMTQEEVIKAWQDWGNTSYRTGQNLVTWNNLLTDYKVNPSSYPDGETYVDGVLYRLAQEDIYKKFITNSFEQIHNFSFQGGSEKSDYRVSFGYADEDGVMITNKDGYKKYNINAYLSTNLTKKLISSTNFMYKNDKRLTPFLYGLLFKQGITTDRTVNSGYHTNPDGSKIPYDTPNNILKDEPPEIGLGDNLRIFEKLEYKVLNDLKLTGEYTFMKSNSNSTEVGTENIYWDFVNEAPAPITTRGAADGGGRASSFYSRSHSNTDYHALNLYINYEKSFLNNNFNFLAGINQEVSKYSSFGTDRLNLLSTSTPSLVTAYGTMSNDESFSEYAVLGYFSRINYNYKDKYLLEANARYDGSSRFPKVSRFGFFPSFSAGWVLTKESFMKPIENIFNLIKIRGSWGEIGNQSISNYAFIPGMSPLNSTWIDPSIAVRYLTISTPALVNSSFTWETVATKNIGVDMSFLNNRLNAHFDYFNRKTLNMFGPGAELPAVLGASAPEKNVADLESKGWELSLNWRDTHEDFDYSFGFNISDDRGFVTKFNNKGGLLSQYYEGYEFGERWGYETYGYFTVDDFVKGSLDNNLMNGKLKEGVLPYYSVIKTNPGDIRYVDLDNDGEISPGKSTLSDPGDQKIIGNSNRRYQFGINGNCSYKNFDLSFFFQGVGKRDIWLSNSLFWPFLGIYDGLYTHQLDNYWTPENTNAFYPRSYQSAGGNTQISRQVQTKYLSNGAYIMLKNIGLGYNLPKSILEKLYITNARVFVSAENLLKLDHLPNGMDPEARVVSYGAVYPFLRKFSFGVNLSF